MLFKDDVIQGRYNLISQMKVSSITETWTALDQSLDRFVQIEFLQKRLINNERMSQLFYNQCIVSAKLIHPNLIPVFDYDNHDGLPYIVKLFVPSLRFFDLIRQDKVMSLASLMSIFQQIASCLDYLHANDIVHRNLKSQNILVGSNNTSYLTGLNVMYHSSSDDVMTKEGVIVGTWQYISPESFLGETSTPHNMPPRDIYSFGVIVFEALSRTMPFHIENGGMREWKEIHSNQDIPLISQHRPDLSISINATLSKLLAKNPKDRYTRATEAVDDLYKAFYSGHSNLDGKIFISYARKDSEYVHKLADELRRIGLDIWIDRDIEAGSNWDDAIENALNACDLMLLITTDASMASEYVTHEWSYFMGSKKPVYPFIPQNPAPDNIHPRLQRVQHMIGTDDMLNNVARIIEMLSSKVSTPANE